MQTPPLWRTWLEGALINIVRLLLWPIPPTLGRLPGALLGTLLFDVLRLARRQTLKNLELAFGDAYTPAQRVALGRACYRHFGTVITEFFMLNRLSRERVARHITLENPEVLEAELAKGKGVLLAIGHFGHWEMLGAGIASHGLTVTAYVGAQHNPIADNFINRTRRHYGMGTLGKNDPMRGMLRELKQNHILALLTDQHYSRNRHFVTFFGHPVSTPPGVGTLMRHAGVAVVFADIHRTGKAFHYTARFERLPDPPAEVDKETALLHVAQNFSDALEAAVRKHPAQYFWMHRRWRGAPPPDKLTPCNRAFLEARGVKLAPPPEGPA